MLPDRAAAATAAAAAGGRPKPAPATLLQKLARERSRPCGSSLPAMPLAEGWRAHRAAECRPRCSTDGCQVPLPAATRAAQTAPAPRPAQPAAVEPAACCTKGRLLVGLERCTALHASWVSRAWPDAALLNVFMVGVQLLAMLLPQADARPPWLPWPKALLLAVLDSASSASPACRRLCAACRMPAAPGLVGRF